MGCYASSELEQRRGFCPAVIERGQEMSTYYLAKAHQEQIRREAKQNQLIKAAKGAKQASTKRSTSRTTEWSTRQDHIARA